jgi:hypothetical protein
MGARSARNADWLRARRRRRIFTPHIDHDYRRVIDDDDHPELRVDIDLGDHVLVRRDDYDNLVTALDHHIYDGVDYPVNDAARILIDHVNDDMP